MCFSLVTEGTVMNMTKSFSLGDYIPMEKTNNEQ